MKLSKKSYLKNLIQEKLQRILNNQGVKQYKEIIIKDLKLILKKIK